MNNLSGGQHQAVCLVMATLAHADVLLLDEHTSALDPGIADFVMGLTEKIVEEKKLTTIIVTYSMRQALSHGDHRLMLHRGKVILDVRQEECKRLDVSNLRCLFQKVRSKILDDDGLLMD
nr:ATP-binding cassette domain-containing protein [Bartonella quintana]